MNRQSDSVLMKEVVPSGDDWGDVSSNFDKKYAYDQFFGKSNMEMQKQYLDDFMQRTTDLKFMPEKPFRYYILGFRDFVLSKTYESVDAPDVANCFVTLIEEPCRAGQ